MWQFCFTSSVNTIIFFYVYCLMVLCWMVAARLQAKGNTMLCYTSLTQSCQLCFSFNQEINASGGLKKFLALSCNSFPSQVKPT